MLNEVIQALLQTTDVQSMAFFGALFSGLMSGLMGGMGGGGADNSAGIAAQDQANKLRITANALTEASQEKAKADEKSIFTEQQKAMDEQLAIQGLIDNFRSTLLGGGQR